MTIITGKRGTGKSTWLLHESARTMQYIVCSHHAVATSLVRAAQNLGLDIPFPLTYEDFLQHRYYGKGIKGFLIDDAESLFQHISGSVSVTAVVLGINEKDNWVDLNNNPDFVI